jgi:methyl-accepting chemotaxis protein
MATKVRFGISQKLLIMLLVVALVPMLSIWYLSYQDITTLTEEKVNKELVAINSELVSHVNDWVDMNKRMLKQNAALESMRSMTGSRQDPVLKSIIDIYNWAYLAFSVDLNGNNIGRSDNSGLKYYGDRDYFKQVVEGKDIGIQILIGKTSGKPAMVMATGIYADDKTLKGVLAQAMTLEDLSSKIVSRKIGQSGFTFLVDETGAVIAHPDAEMTRLRLDLSKHSALQGLKKGLTTAVFKDFNGKKIVTVAQTTEQGWMMVSQQDYAEAYQLLAGETKKALGMLGLTLIVVIIIALMVAKWLTAPIRNLTEVAEKYSQGQLDLAISGLDRNDEIGHLGQAIERLGTSIRMAMERLQKKK